MAKHESYESRTEELVMPILLELGLSLVDVEYVREVGDWYLRIYIDKEGGVGVLDCEAVSRALDVKLDEADFIKDPYILEVSSPGLGRPLKKEKDYVRNTGKPVEIRLYKAVDNEKELVGDLVSFDKEIVTISTNAGEKAIEKKNIALIREYVDWNE